VAIVLYQLPGSNELKTAGLVKKEIADMAKSFPPGVEYSLPFAGGRTERRVLQLDRTESLVTLVEH